MISALDIVVALALVSRDRDSWTYASLGELVGVSASAAHRAVESLKVAGLYDDRGGRVRTAALHELLVHAAKYLLPPQFGPPTRGLATGPFAEPLAAQVVAQNSEDGAWVWPYPEGTRVGTSLAPIHPNAPAIAVREPELGRRLAVVDALRAGRAREVRAAADWLRGDFERGAR